MIFEPLISSLQSSELSFFHEFFQACMCQIFHHLRDKRASLLCCCKVRVPSETVYKRLQSLEYFAITYCLSLLICTCLNPYKILFLKPLKLYVPKHILPDTHFKKWAVLYTCFSKIDESILFAKCRFFKVTAVLRGKTNATLSLQDFQNYLIWNLKFFFPISGKPPKARGTGAEACAEGPHLKW